MQSPLARGCSASLEPVGPTYLAQRLFPPAHRALPRRVRENGTTNRTQLLRRENAPETEPLFGEAKTMINGASIPTTHRNYCRADERQRPVVVRASVRAWFKTFRALTVKQSGARLCSITDE